MKAGASNPALSIIGLVAFLLEAGCGASAPVRKPSWTSPRPTPDRFSRRPARIDGLTTGDRGNACTVRSAETTVRAQIVDRGAALVFTTGDDVATLREHVSALSVSAFLRSTHHRFDNIQAGVRLVFEAEGGQEVAAVQQDVVRHAREMAKACGLVLAAPTDWNVEQQQRAESAASAAGPSTRTKQHSKKAAQPGPNAEKPKERQHPSATPKSEGKPKPAPAQAPKPADKPKETPKQELKPREDRKPEIPRLPRLPGPRPNPFAAIASLQHL